MRPALARRLLLMTLLLVSLTLFATTLGAMRLPLVNLLPSGDEMLRHIWLSIRLPRVLLALLGKAFSPKAGRIIVTALWGIFSIFYMGQVVYYAIFKVLSLIHI